MSSSQELDRIYRGYDYRDSRTVLTMKECCTGRPPRRPLGGISWSNKPGNYEIQQTGAQQRRSVPGSGCSEPIALERHRAGWEAM
jgi:hypothetical protein